MPSNKKSGSFNKQREIEKILGEKIDQSASIVSNIGKKHILTQLREDITIICGKISYTAAEAPEIDTEWFCFDALNTPESHPARAPESRRHQWRWPDRQGRGRRETAAHRQAFRHPGCRRRRQALAR